MDTNGRHGGDSGAGSRDDYRKPEKGTKSSAPSKQQMEAIIAARNKYSALSTSSAVGTRSLRDELGPKLSTFQVQQAIRMAQRKSEEHLRENKTLKSITDSLHTASVGGNETTTRHLPTAAVSPVIKTTSSFSSDNLPIPKPCQKPTYISPFAGTTDPTGRPEDGTSGSEMASKQPFSMSALRASLSEVTSTRATSADITTQETNTESASGGMSLKEKLRLYRENQEAQQAQELLDREEEKARINAPKPIFNKDKVSPKILEDIRNLPIFSLKEELLDMVRKNQFVIVIGETGSGKSTQIPQYLVEAGFSTTGKIGVTQPRRVAAKSLATRVAVECGVKVGESVGYAFRFEKTVSAETVVKYLTDGLLVRECASEANLDGYSVIIIDEAHERSIHTDVCFGLLKRAARRRPDLKVIISSATLDKEKFAEFFNAPIFNVSGKVHPVVNIYSPKAENECVKGAVQIIKDINRREPRNKEGDILVFFSGQDEIDAAWDLIDQQMHEISGSLNADIIVLPCYGALPMEEQQKIFVETPANCRKVVLATNIAETSVTIDGIAHVIDCGYYKQNEYNPRSGISSLVKRRTTLFQAVQRAGRAGRTQTGWCYRLYQKEEERFMKASPDPEITRCNVQSVVLALIAMGIEDPMAFEFMDPPPEVAIMEAVEHLQEMSALNAELKLTPLGTRMAEFPLDPPLAKVVLESDKLGCSGDVLKIVALMSANYQNIFVGGKRNRKAADEARKRFIDVEGGDLITFLKVYDAWTLNQQSEQWCRHGGINYRVLLEAEEIAEQLKEILQSRGISQGHGAAVSRYCSRNQNIARAFTSGYFRQFAKKKPTGHAYQVVGSKGSFEDVYLHPTCCLFAHKPPFVIYHEVVKTTKPFMKGVTPIDPQWIREYAPQFAAKLSSFGMFI